MLEHLTTVVMVIRLGGLTSLVKKTGLATLQTPVRVPKSKNVLVLQNQVATKWETLAGHDEERLDEFTFVLIWHQLAVHHLMITEIKPMVMATLLKLIHLYKKLPC